MTLLLDSIHAHIHDHRFLLGLCQTLRRVLDGTLERLNGTLNELLHDLQLLEVRKRRGRRPSGW